MPQFSDDLFLGSAQTYMGTNTNSNLGDPSPMDIGVGPVGRIYVWDTVPAAKATNNLVTSTTPTGAGSLTLAAGAGVTAVTLSSGSTAYQLDVPRAVAVTQVTAGTARNFTVTGYDWYGQPMSELIVSVAGSTVNGKKAFYQITGITVSGATTTAVTVGTTDILGSPVRIPNAGYVARAGWNDTLAEDAGTLADAVATTPSTTTGDVRGTYVPSSACDGTKRLVMGILLPALAVGPNATRAGALGVNQNLVS